VPLSKNAQKRLIKAARRAEQKSERRAKEKARRKEKKRLLALRTDDDDLLPRPTIVPVPFDARVIIDLGFDELMTPKVLLVVHCYRISRFLKIPSRNVLLSARSCTTHTLRCARASPPSHPSYFPRSGDGPESTSNQQVKARTRGGSRLNGGKIATKEFGLRRLNHDLRVLKPSLK
jgi:hypothetical protein